MNKTVTINISGLVFHIDEDAFNKLSLYLNAIKNSLNTEGKEEILSDIESRIAEIFNERINGSAGVVGLNDVDYVERLMGKPEDYRLDDENSEHNTQAEKKESYTHTNYSGNRSKKLYRDGNKRVLGGVLSGLGHYFNVDPVWFRIIFILLLFLYGLSFLIYPILWIIIPKAKTTSEILEMYGEPVTVENIEKKNKENYNESGERINTYDAYRNRSGNSAEIVKKIIGMFLIIFSILSIMGTLIVPFAFQSSNFTEARHITQILQADLNVPIWWFSVSLFLMCAIPFIILLFVGLKIYYKNIKYVGIVSIILAFFWAAAIFFFSYLMIQVDYKQDAFRKLIREQEEHHVVKKSLDHIKNDTLSLEFIRDPRIFNTNDSVVYHENDNVEMVIRSTNQKEGYLEIDSEYSHNFRSDINITKNGVRISTNKNDRSNWVDYYSEIKGNEILLANAVLTTNKDYTLDNQIKISLYLPDNYKIKLNSEVGRYLDEDYFENEKIYDGTHYYVYTNGKLKCTTCN